MTDYSSKGHYYIDAPRKEVLKLVGMITNNARLLDVGAGYGNNTKLLLSLRHNVTALETNKAAVRELKLLKESFPNKLEIVMDSVDTFQPKHNYDAIICCMVLHFLEDKDTARRVINDMKTWTKPGGFNLVISYLDVNKLDDEFSFLLKTNELRELYAGWDVIWYEESYSGNLKKKLIKLMRRQKRYKAARLIAKKPS